MTEPKVIVSIAPLLVDRETAARMLAMSLDSFERRIQPDLRIVRQGRLRLVPVTELERWVRENARPTLESREA